MEACAQSNTTKLLHTMVQQDNVLARKLSTSLKSLLCWGVGHHVGTARLRAAAEVQARTQQQAHSAVAQEPRAEQLHAEAPGRRRELLHDAQAARASLAGGGARRGDAAQALRGAGLDAP